jgi:hypothetical protein
VPVIALPASAPPNPIVSVHVTDPPGAGDVLTLLDRKVRFVVVPDTVRVPDREMVPASAAQIPAGLTAVSVSVPVVSAVPVTFAVDDDGWRSVIFNVPFNVRVDRHVCVDVVVVTIIWPVKVPEYAVLVVEGVVESFSQAAAVSARIAASARTEARRTTIHYGS